jgi:8-amino-7-oxononanoate synthase
MPQAGAMPFYKEDHMVNSAVRSKPIVQKCLMFTDADDSRASGLYPYFKPIEKNIGTKVVIDGRELIMAGSNNYLGLATDSRVRLAAISAIEEFGTSCSGSRFMNGSLTLHEELERRLAAFVGKESALCFTTGYMTNLGAISALVQRGDHVISDRYNHASIVDGICMATGLHHRVNFHRYKHNDIIELEALLKKIPVDSSTLIITDGVFSMEGDIVDLPTIRRLAEQYGACLYLDEAHAMGVLGSTGRGTTEHFGGNCAPDLVMCTFSKAFGSTGGFVAGDRAIIDYVKHTSRPLIFSASIPPASIAAVLKALDIIEEEPQRIHRLQQIAQKMRRGLKGLGYDIGAAQTPIIPLVIGDPEKTFRLFQAFFNRGVYVNPVITPAVPPDRCLLRTSYMATHTDDELDTILSVAEDEGKRLGVIP